MNLEELIPKLSEADDELIIFMVDSLNVNSAIELLLVDENESNLKIEKDGQSLFYLLEVFLAKEFVSDFLETSQFVPTNKETAQRLFEYAINDA